MGPSSPRMRRGGGEIEGAPKGRFAISDEFPHIKSLSPPPLSVGIDSIEGFAILLDDCEASIGLNTTLFPVIVRNHYLFLFLLDHIAPISLSAR